MKTNAIEFGGYLKMLRKRQNLTIRELEDKSGVSFSYLSQMENGKRGVPSPEILKKISIALGVEYDEIMTKAGYLDSQDIIVRDNLTMDLIPTLGTKVTNRVVNDDSVIKIPIYGTIKAGYDYVAEQNIVGYTFASKKEISDGEYFYLIVKGDSMIDEGIREGFKVLVKKQTFVENGKIGVVIVNGDEATLKRVYYDGDKVILQASNKNIPPRILSIQDVFIQGQVKMVVFDV
ncbi:transcriptional repressor LexA [Paenibacillus vulneris]|uniref:Helix-turn-helix domain-containing protein n=1 Tax=Paenibacillus vulneris TaxID=1133364 RepID=A0ABW3UF23_9BACL